MASRLTGSRRLRCAECGGPLHSVKPWRQADVLGKPIGRRRELLAGVDARVAIFIACPTYGSSSTDTAPPSARRAWL